MRRIAGILKFFWRSRLLGRDIPLIASVKLSYRCNLACRACPFHSLSGGPETHMTWDTARRSLDTLAQSGCPIVVFEGGEPLLWEDGGHSFSDLALYARERFSCVAATTNGTLDLDVPTDILWVSIDGTRDTHNVLRSGSYDGVMENLRFARHPRLYVHTTLNRLNWKELRRVVETVTTIPAVKGITVQLFYAYDQGEDDLALSAQDRQNALLSALALKKEGYPVLNSSWSLKAMINNTWTCRERLLANINPDGRMSVGCYVKDRGRVVCTRCGFTPVAEASGAYALVPGALLAGMRVFLAS
ncbi:MAG: hypothetical protein MUD15_13200 [Desulfobacterota bacterium]|jgi:MoaA/NifB/PqqE/SkfB family radical SAM enzyme|nr:hypothetical protein [Thermodesulfobacteriota bacterium]